LAPKEEGEPRIDMKRSMLVLIVVLSIACMTIGGTFAGFCDTETIMGNAIDMSSLDLKVAKCTDSCEPGELEFRDDAPWGAGLVPCFEVEEENAFAPSYECNLVLWNAGSADGELYVYFKNVIGLSANPESHLNTTVLIWYDENDDGVADERETVTGKLGDLAYQSLTGNSPWLLPGNTGLNLTILIYPEAGSSPGDFITFDIEFGLIGIFFDADEMIASGFCDTETCLNNYLRVIEGTEPP
jgi:hypothetical protein